MYTKTQKHKNTKTQKHKSTKTLPKTLPKYGNHSVRISFMYRRILRL